jgi:rubredoxin
MIFEDTIFFHNCGCKVHFECLENKSFEDKTWNFVCPNCRDSKNVFNLFQKMTAESKDRESLLNLTRRHSYIQKKRKKTNNKMLSMMEDFMNIEGDRVWKHSKNERLLHDITIQNKKKGISSYNVLYNYFNL